MPDDGQEIQIIDARRLPSANPKRMGMHDRLVIYQADDYTRGTVTVPDESFSEDRLKQAIRADLAERSKWQGRRLKL